MQSSRSAQNIQGDSELTLAAAAGNVAVVTSLLGAGADPGQMNRKGHCALVRAARQGHAKIIRLLNGSPDDEPLLPQPLQLALAWAASRGHTEAVVALLDAGANIDGVTPTEHTALMLAASNGHADTVRALLQRDASPSMTTHEGATALTLAEQHRQDKVCKYLRRWISESRVDAPHFSSSRSTSSASTDTPSWCSTSSTSTTSTSSTSFSQVHLQPPLDMPYKLQAGSGPSVPSRANGLTQQEKDRALMEAVKTGNDLIAEPLLAAGADVNAEDGEGRPALMVAIDMGHAHIMEVLLKYHADIDHSNKATQDTLSRLTRRSDEDAIDIIKLLLTHTAAIGRAVQTGWRPLNSAAETMNIGLASLLLRNHVPIDAADASGNTCLTLAADSGNLKFVTFLLEENADIDQANEAGNTALILAASKGHKDTVLELLAHGANILRRNNAGMNAGACASKNSLQEITVLLQDAAAFLQAAAQETAVDFEKKIRKDWLNCVDGSGRTALIIAVKNGCVKNAALLMKKRAALDSQDSDGNTALLIAAHHPVHREELLRVLLSEPLHQPNLLLKNKMNTGIRELLQQASYHYPVPRKLLLDAFTKSGKALLEVCRQGKISDAKTLLMRGADTMVMNRHGNCALHIVAIDGNHDIVQLLLDHGAMIDVVNGENRTPLYLAARWGNIGVVYQLLQSGASPGGIADALLSEEADITRNQPSSSSSTGQTAAGLNRDIILDLLKFHRYLSGADADMPVPSIPSDALFKSVQEVNAPGTRPHESLASCGLCRHIIAGLRERSAEWGSFEKAMVAEDASELVSAGQKQACWAAVLSSLWDHALGRDAKKLLADDHVPVLAVQRYSRLLKQQVIWLLNTAACAEKAIFDKMLGFDAPIAAEFARYGGYHSVAHYRHLRNCGMASVLADFITARYQRVVGLSHPSGISRNGFAKAVDAALNAQEFIQMLEKWFIGTQDDSSIRAMLNRQIDQLKLACKRLPDVDWSG